MIPAKKLFLASAVAALSTSAFAMETMSDESLSEATGQDGITLSITTPASGISFETRIHDADGVSTSYATGVTNAGAIVIGSSADTSNSIKASLATPGTSAPIVVNIDAGGTTATSNSAVLNVNVAIPTGTVIHTGALSVARSAGMGAAITQQTNAIIKDATITLGATTLNIQLGNAPQGDMIKLNTSMTGGLTINNFALNDTAASGGGALSASSIVMRDTGGGANLTVVAGAGIKTTGLYVNLTQLGAAGTSGGFDQRITALQFGTAPAIGNVEIIGLNLNGTVLNVAGH